MPSPAATALSGADLYALCAAALAASIRECAAERVKNGVVSAKADAADEDEEAEAVAERPAIIVSAAHFEAARVELFCPSSDVDVMD